MELEWGLIRFCFNAHGSVKTACICTWPFQAGSHHPSRCGRVPDANHTVREPPARVMRVIEPDGCCAVTRLTVFYRVQQAVTNTE